jgi:uncharacterized HAD superfamily protein
MIIGVDIDNVIADTEKELRRVIFEKMGLKLDREDITSYSLDNIAGIEREDLIDILGMFDSGDIFLGLEVIDGARETLGMLKKSHEIVLVTSRPEGVREHTSIWLEREGIPYDKLLFASKTKVNGVPYELFIEDQDKFACELAEDGTFVLLFDAPWNRHVRHENINRVYTWEDVRKFCFPSCALGH